MQVKLKDVLHLYIGQGVMFGFEGQKKKGLLVGKQEPFGWQVFDPSFVLGYYRKVCDELIKPILRPLSDMTEEEADRYNTLRETLFDVADMINRVRQEAACVKYLLSRGFDLFGLLESGEAIDKTKL